MILPQRLKLGAFPTPIQRLDNLARFLGGPTIYLKRDDLSGLALGGNKIRGLEFILAEAHQQNATHIITWGGPCSNQASLTVAAARHAGFQPVVILITDQSAESSNVRMMQLMDTDIRCLASVSTPNLTTLQRDQRNVLAAERKAETVASEIASQGGNPFIVAATHHTQVPRQSVTDLWAMGFVNGGCELAEQCRERSLHFDAILVASASGYTQAGLEVGLKLAKMQPRLVAWSTNLNQNSLKERVAQICRRLISRLSVECDLELGEIVIDDTFADADHPETQSAKEDALHLVAKAEGILFDPIYSTAMVAGLVKYVREEYWDHRHSVLLWHTGGVIAAVK